MYKLFPGALIGSFPYRIERKLGGGPNSMSEIYLATVLKPFQEQQGRASVVLKIAGPEKIETNNRSIRNEEEYLPGLDNAGIVRILPILSDENPPRRLGYRARTALPGEPWFCIVEHIPGCSLAELIRRKKWKLSTHFALKILIDVVDTVQYLHAKQIVHMDIKPSNILLRDKGLLHLARPILIDFGICRKVGQKTSGGTPGYMASERQKEYSEVPAHPSMDIYALGILAQEMLNKRVAINKAFPEFLTLVLAADWKMRPTLQAFAAELYKFKAKLKFYHWLWLLVLAGLIADTVLIAQLRLF